jgi:hypothetical protein
VSDTRLWYRVLDALGMLAGIYAWGMIGLVAVAVFVAILVLPILALWWLLS